MHPLFRILADSKDVTEAVRDRLLELTLTDEAGIKSDQMRLTLDDRRREDGGIAALPRMGMTLEVSLGYAETSLRSMGAYLVDEVELRHPPATLTVGGKAADMAGPFRSRKTRSWDKTTLGDMVARIAAEHGYSPKVDKALGGVVIPHEDQRAESDMALLTRLAEAYDAVAKPVHGHFVLARAGEAKATSGASLPVVSLALTDITSWSYKQSARSPGGKAKDEGSEKQYGGCKARWYDVEANKEKFVTVGKEPFEDLPYRSGSEAEAKASAATRMNKGKRKEGGLSLTLPGNPNLAAECRLHIALRPGLATDWRITKVEHRLSNSGYTTQVEAELFLQGQEKVTVAAGTAGQGAKPNPKPDPKPDPNPDPKPEEPENPQWPSEEQNRFELLRDSLESRPDITPKERLLLCIPDIVEVEAKKLNADNRRGWMYLRSFLHRWFSGPANTNAAKGGEPMWVDMEWLLSYARVMVPYRNLIQDEHLFSPKACDTLARVLLNDEKLTDTKTPFDHTVLPWTEWKKLYFQDCIVYGHMAPSADGLLVSMGNFNLRTLAAGYTEPHPDGGHYIRVERVSVIAWDSFNFDDPNDELRYWSCADMFYSYKKKDSATEIFNRDFQNFRKKFSQGNDFMVLAGPKNVENLMGIKYSTNL